MAKCEVCGERAGAFKQVCASCESKALSEKKLEAERDALREAERLEEKAAKWEEDFRLSLSSETPKFIYKAAYVEVDSEVNRRVLGEFNIASIQQMGIWGWRVVGIIPKTIGVGLTNTRYANTGKSDTWGGGMGGNVNGVYVLLEKTVSSIQDADIEEAIETGKELIRAGLAL